MATTTFKSHKNNATSTLETGINDAITTVVLAAGGGAEFPASNFWITIFDVATSPDAGNEIMLVGSRSTDTLTITQRGDQGTTPAEWSAGAAIQNLWTLEDVTEITAAINGIEGGTQTLDSVSTSGDITVGTDGSGNVITGSGNTTVACLNTVATTVNAFGASTALNMGNASGTTTIAGKLHVDVEDDGVRFGPAPTAAASADGDNLIVVEAAGNTGISIISNDASNTNLFFGDNAANNSGQILYQHSDNSMIFNTAATTALTIDEDQNAEFAGDVEIDGGSIIGGVAGVQAGLLRLHGAPTSSTEGGEIQLFVADDYDTPIAYWRIDVYQDDIRIFPDGSHITTFKANGDISLMDGNLIITTPSTPASSSAGTIGTIAWDADYIYVCTATGAPGTWKRAALTGGY